MIEPERIRNRKPRYYYAVDRIGVQATALSVLLKAALSVLLKAATITCARRRGRIGFPGFFASFQKQRKPFRFEDLPDDSGCNYVESASSVLVRGTIVRLMQFWLPYCFRCFERSGLQ